jgi:hypothetical protein
MVLADSSEAGAASGIHNYSLDYEQNTSNYTGIGVYRTDQHVTGIPLVSCFNYYGADALYQTEWLNVTSDNQNWLEIGTGHQCGDNARYWYAGYGYAGVWYPLWEQSGITNGQTHKFTIVSFGSGNYGFYVDSTLEATQTTSEAQAISTATESYWSGSSTAYQDYNMVYTLNYGTTTYNWVEWSDRVDPYMCGHFVSGNDWSTGENASC